jgi:dTDP-glucose 4,6-dehydratase
MRLLVTGGAGFIGSAVVRRAVGEGWHVTNLDALTYAGDPRTVESAAGAPNYAFVHADICDAEAVAKAFETARPDAVIHLAAESHVDRSIDGPAEFLRTNIDGTACMLEAALTWYRSLEGAARQAFRFVHVSTDEVYGDLQPDDPAFKETTPYAPNSPYAASKASADHLARAWNRTYGLPVVITNCSNNYGAFQHPEKLIPTVIRKALSGQDIPIYGTGENVRDWLYVEDHVTGLLKALERGRPGEKYNFGGGAEITNIEMARRLCALLDEKRPRGDGQSYAEQITFVTDRPGHDFRYAVASDKAWAALVWKPAFGPEEGLSKTVDWYLAHADWLIRNEAELARLGLGEAPAAV